MMCSHENELRCGQHRGTHLISEHQPVFRLYRSEAHHNTPAAILIYSDIGGHLGLNLELIKIYYIGIESSKQKSTN